MKIALTAVKSSLKIGDQSPMEGEQPTAPWESVVGVAITPAGSGRASGRIGFGRAGSG